MILVIDESPQGETSLDYRLRRVGYPTSHVNSARGALAFVRKYPRFEPLMIVIDRKISEREGERLKGLLQKDAESASKRVLMYTSLSGSAAPMDDNPQRTPIPADDHYDRANELLSSLRAVCEVYDRVCGPRQSPAAEALPAADSGVR